MPASDSPRKVFAVTGGASGIGAAAVALLASRGHAVVVMDVQPPASTPAGDVRFIRTDVADEASVRSAFADIDAAGGGLAALVNSAGVESKFLLASMTLQAWERVQRINLTGTLLCLQAAAGLMRRQGGGAIVNVASIAGKRMSYSGDAAYTASKSAVLGLTRHAAFELAADGIRVNAVCPGPTLTPMITRNLGAERIAAVARTVPMGRWVQASDIANAIEFLATDASAMCTGIALDVDGGVLVSNGSAHADYFAARQ